MLRSWWLLWISLLLPPLTHADGARVGELAPALVLPVLSAEGLETAESALSLQSLRGQVVYLDFWASWCGPCRVSFPQLDAIRRELAADGFEVVAVNVDEFEADARQFLQEVPVSYPVLRDATGDSPGRYGVLGMPTGYLIDRQGVVRAVHQGYRKSDGARLRSAIIELMGAGAP